MKNRYKRTHNKVTTNEKSPETMAYIEDMCNLLHENMRDVNWKGYL